MAAGTRRAGLLFGHSFMGWGSNCETALCLQQLIKPACSLSASDECMHTTHTNIKLLIHNNRCQDSVYLYIYFPQTVSRRKWKENGRVSCDSASSWHVIRTISRSISTILHHTKLPYDNKQLFLLIVCVSCVAAVCVVITSNMLW